MAEIEVVVQTISEALYKTTDTFDDLYDFIRETSEDIMSAVVTGDHAVINEYRDWLIANGYTELSRRLVYARNKMMHSLSMAAVE